MAFWRCSGGIRVCNFRKTWHVRALGDLDPDRILLSGREIVMFQHSAQPTGLDAHDRIDLRIEILFASEHRGRNAVGLYAVCPPGDGLLNDVA
jgi:hypothetical protein